MFDTSRYCPLRRLLAAALAVTVFFASGHAMAQAWPAKPIRVIVNFGPGSSPDIVARTVATPLSQALGQPVTVENRAGAGGQIGVDAVIKSPADGYTLLLSSGSAISITPHLQKLAYDPLKELVPVAAGARLELLLVSRGELPFKDYDGFLKHMRTHPGRLSYGSPGSGSSPHIAAEMLKSVTNTFAVHIPYRGSAGVLQDLLAGTLDWAFDPGVAVPHIRAGKLTLLAVTGPRRLGMFPNTPTLRELGLAEFDVGTTHGFWAPAGTPPAIVERLNREINRALATASVVEAIRALGAAEPTPLTPAEFLAVTQADSVRYARIIRERKIAPD